MLNRHPAVLERWQAKLLGWSETRARRRGEAPRPVRGSRRPGLILVGSMVAIMAVLLPSRGLRSPCESIVSKTAGQLQVQVKGLQTEGELVLGAAKIQDLSELAQVTALRLKTCCIVLEAGKISAEQFQQCQQTHAAYRGHMEELMSLVREATRARQDRDRGLYEEKAGAVEEVLERARATSEELGRQAR